MKHPSHVPMNSAVSAYDEPLLVRALWLLAMLAMAFIILGGCGRNRADETADSAQPETNATAVLLQQYRQTSTPAVSAAEQPTVLDLPSITPSIPLPSATPASNDSPTPLIIIPVPTSTLSDGIEVVNPEDVLPTATPTTVVLEPTDTPTVEPEPTSTNTPIPFPSPSPSATPTMTPTITPTATTTSTPEDTPTPVSLDERDVVADGYTLMRLALSGEGFDSTGRPINTDFDERTTQIGGGIQAAYDRWCTQLGLVHIWVDLTYQLDKSTGELIVTGSVSLHAGFCEDPVLESQDILGNESLMDYTDIDLRVPVGTTAQITYNLQAESSLFGISGLLDSDTGAIVELHVTHKQP